MSFAIALSDEQWELVADLFDPPGRRGAPAVIPRRQMVDAQTVRCGRYGPAGVLAERASGTKPLTSSMGSATL
jgi:hypothetical protein